MRRTRLNQSPRTRLDGRTARSLSRAEASATSLSSAHLPPSSSSALYFFLPESEWQLDGAITSAGSLSSSARTSSRRERLLSSRARSSPWPKVRSSQTAIASTRGPTSHLRRSYAGPGPGAGGATSGLIFQILVSAFLTLLGGVFSGLSVGLMGKSFLVFGTTLLGVRSAPHRREGSCDRASVDLAAGMDRTAAGGHGPRESQKR